MTAKHPSMSRRGLLLGGAGLGVALGLNSVLVGRVFAASNDNTTPDERDAQWLKATQKYAPERKRWLSTVDAGDSDGPFRPDWASLQDYKVPQWYADAKFGIFVHWGLYSIPAFVGEWYSRNMYIQGSPEYEHHIKTYGPHTKFGYKDFIPQFTASAFDPANWAQLFADAGARYVVPVAEHHDGFSMYDSHLSDYTAVKMGPKRDLLGEIKKAVKDKGLHFALSSHRAEHDWFFDGGRQFPSDVSDPANAGLYGPAQDRMAGKDDQDLFGDYTHVSQAWLDDWLARQAELVSAYNPDLIYFDWWIGQPSFRNTLPKFLAWYYNKAVKEGGSAIVNYKLGEFADGAGVLDIERGQAPGIRNDVWQTCTSISDKAWGYIENDTYKSPAQLIHLLADVVSKNGNLLLNVGPHADGRIPEAARDSLMQMGAWLKINGEAIYGTRPWIVFGEGPTETASGTFAETKAQPYTAQDFRFTVKDDVLHAIEMARPEGEVTITSVRSDYRVKNVRLLGTDTPVTFRQDAHGLTITLPAGAPEQLAYVWRIET
ncbi:MAG: alpha-L-fucosidase [Asticcacaulis sp.]|uniref:alpha-L-fucosidase n=1 Tax=Asticcacaulis sp. TaxID=1872648 RepID=UPI0039E62198